MRVPAVLCAAAVLVSACDGSAADPVAPSLSSEASLRAHLDLLEERAALAASADALSQAIGAQGVAAALTAVLADDAVFLSPRTNAVAGNAAVADFLASNPVAPSALSWTTIKSDVSNDASQGYTWAQGSVTIDIGSGPLTLPGMALIYWTRAAAGDDWRIGAINVSSGGPQALPLPDGFGTPDTKHRRNFPNTDAATEADRLLAVDRAFSDASLERTLGVAFQAFAAPDGIAVGGGQFVYGPEAIGEAFAATPDDHVSWVPRFAGAAESGDLGFTVGDASFILPDLSFYTKYLTIWQKQDTGEWRFVADFGSSRPAP
jgi:ketosteroid isomerase-like protein